MRRGRGIRKEHTGLPEYEEGSISSPGCSLHREKISCVQLEYVNFSICTLYFDTFFLRTRHSGSKFENSVHPWFKLLLFYIRINEDIFVCWIYNKCWWILIIPIIAVTGSIYLLAVILAKTFLVKVYINLFPSLLPWQSFCSYISPVLKSAFRSLIPLSGIYIARLFMAVYELRSHPWGMTLPCCNYHEQDSKKAGGGQSYQPQHSARWSGWGQRDVWPLPVVCGNSPDAYPEPEEEAIAKPGLPGVILEHVHHLWPTLRAYISLWNEVRDAVARAALGSSICQVPALQPFSLQWTSLQLSGPREALAQAAGQPVTWWWHRSTGCCEACARPFVLSKGLGAHCRLVPTVKSKASPDHKKVCVEDEKKWKALTMIFEHNHKF